MERVLLELALAASGTVMALRLARIPDSRKGKSE